MLQNERVLLRPIEPEDLETLYAIENDTEMWNVGANVTPYSYFALRQYMESQPADIFQTGQVRLAIVDKRTGKSVGFADLFHFSPIDAKAEVGVAILKEEQGKGYGRKSLELLDVYARQFLRLRMLYAQVSKENNQACLHLFEDCGFEVCATLPQWHFREGQYEDVVILQKFL